MVLDNKKHNLHAAAEVIQSLGLHVDSVKTSTGLKVSDVSIWQVIAPSLAIYDCPQVLRQSKNFFYKNIYQFMRMNGSMMRDFIVEIKAAIKFQETTISEGDFVLFLAFESRQIIGCEKVFENLKRLGFRIVILTTTKGSFSNKIKECADVIEIESFLSFDLIKRIKKSRRAIYKEFKKIVLHLLTDSRNSDTNTQLFLSFLISYSTIKYLIFRPIKELLVSLCFLSKFRPQAIIAMDDTDTRTRAFLLSAKEKGIPTLHIQYGITFATNFEWKFSSCRKIAVWGEETLKLLLDMGLNERKLQLTGNPRFDYLQSLQLSDEKLRNIASKWGSERILFTSQPFVVNAFKNSDHRLRLIDSISDAFQEIPSFSLMIRPHPDEDSSELKLKFSRLKGQANLVLDKNLNLRDAIASSQALITFHSTTVVEAVILGKPVILMGDSVNYFNESYINSGVALLAKDSDELVFLLKQLKEDKDRLFPQYEAKRKLFLRNNIFSNDGLSSKRVSNLITHLVDTKI